MLPQICSALEAAGIVKPFPIQAMTIPLSLVGTDLIGQARTGTGKTLAFGITVLQRITLEGDEDYESLAHPGKPQALVMCPTRELAVQVAKDLQVASTERKARILTIYGGVSYDVQLDALAAGVDVVVGTPGRLLDLANRRSLDLSHLKIVVLDEADEMLDLGFLPDVERLLGKTPGDRQTLLFSATMPPAIMALARSSLNRPINIRAEGHDAQATVPDIEQHIYQAHDLDKPEIVARILQSRGTEKVMVFTRTKRAAQRLADDLEERGFAATSIHGDLNQNAREKALKRFRSGQVSTLVATDVAARGIDVTGVSHVINYECPDADLTYVHRIGRTGRAGAKGVAVTLVDWADVTRWKVINNTLALDFPEPPETYSTSEHLFSDLDIPAEATGRIADPKPTEAKAGGSRGGRKSGERTNRSRGSAEKPAEAAETKPRPKRRRRRVRQGEVVNDTSSQSE